MRGSEEAEFFVVADGRGVEACAMGELTDFHVLIPFEVETVYQPVNVEDGSVEILRCAQDDEHMATVAIVAQRTFAAAQQIAGPPQSQNGSKDPPLQRASAPEKGLT